MRRVLLSCVAAVAASTSAFAADLPSRQVVVPPPPPVFTWTGFYLGAQIGYEFGNNTSFVAGISPAVYPTPEGVVGGGHAGYNFQSGQAVFGIEGDVNGSSYSGNVTSPFDGTFISSHIPFDGSVRGRIGIASFDHVLIYATGGVAFASIKDSYSGGFGLASATQGRVGWTAGVGVEYAIDNNWSVRVEYRRTDYGYLYDYLPTVPFPRSNSESDNRVQVGFSYKFTAFAPPTPVVAKY
jgi:outer membrane immunogenic protein